jgi:uncharacterized ubiquitin-like protein YukD
MLMVEVYVPSLDKTYDFKLNEDVPVYVVIDEISAVICQKEQCLVSGEKDKFMLFKKDKSQILSTNLTLYENEIKTGDLLMLI